MRIMLTGANGYVGRSLAKHLERHNEVFTHTRKVCDLLDTEAVDGIFNNNNFDIVIHCAVVGGSRLKNDHSEVLYENMQMFLNIFKNKDRYRKLIHFGSGAQHCSSEPYGISKRAISNIIDSTPGCYNINIYGLFDEYEKNTRFIKSNVKRALGGKNIIVHKDKKMDFFHMKDLLKLVEYYIANDTLEKNIDCSYKTSLTLLEIANIIKLRCNPAVDIKIIDSGYEEYSGANTSHLNQIIGSDFLPRLEETIDKIKLNVQGR